VYRFGPPPVLIFPRFSTACLRPLAIRFSSIWLPLLPPPSSYRHRFTIVRRMAGINIAHPSSRPAFGYLRSVCSGQIHFTFSALNLPECSSQIPRNRTFFPLPPQISALRGRYRNQIDDSIDTPGHFVMDGVDLWEPGACRERDLRDSLTLIAPASSKSCR